MSNFHIEVHTKDNQSEHYLVQNVVSEQEARIALTEYFHTRERLLAPSFHAALADARFHFYVFVVVELEADKPVIYISGEYRSPYPL